MPAVAPERAEAKAATVWSVLATDYLEVCKAMAMAAMTVKPDVHSASIQLEGLDFLD